MEEKSLRNGERYVPTCVIAGAGPRLGLAVAERYAREGFAAYMLSRNPARLASHFSKLRAGSLQVEPMACDVGTPESVEAALREIRSRQGGCDVLVYNAFVPSAGRASLLDPEALQADIRVNVTAALLFVRLTVQEMREHGGAMLFSGCGLAENPVAQLTSLSVGKAALRAFVECLAEDVEPDGIRVGMVTVNGPMPTRTAELRAIADLYWASFALDSGRRGLEMIYQPTSRKRRAR
jgi:NAD(P)-dependent dehydrogenase (short-subunit alcohol dehydrogenase family)